MALYKCCIIIIIIIKFLTHYNKYCISTDFAVREAKLHIICLYMLSSCCSVFIIHSVTNVLSVLSEVALDAHDHTAVATWCKTNDISLVIVGPENLLAEGICDSLIDAGK